MRQFVLIALLLIPISSKAYAYLGPGVASGYIMATIGIVIAIIAGLFGLIWFPLKRLLNKATAKKNEKRDKID